MRVLENIEEIGYHKANCLYDNTYRKNMTCDEFARIWKDVDSMWGGVQIRKGWVVWVTLHFVAYKWSAKMKKWE